MGVKGLNPYTISNGENLVVKCTMRLYANSKELNISIKHNALRDPVKPYYLPKEQISNVSCIIDFMT